jgi:hypothetical protein
MTYVFVNLILGAVALLILLSVRPAGARVRYVAVGLCLGVAGGIVAVNATTSTVGLSRDSNVEPVVKYALERADVSRPQILFVGSSYTALGVDAALVESELNRSGYRLQVLDLAKPGNYMISQDHTVDYYLSRAKKVPEIVFLEIGPEYYNDTGAMGASYLYTGTAISDHAPDQLLWRSRSIAAYRKPLPEKFDDYWNLATHSIFHIFDFGLSGQLVSNKAIAARPAFAPEESARNPVKAADISDLTQPSQLLSDGPLPQKVRFILAFRRMQIRKLKARGVKIVGFYQTEMAPLEMRDYGQQVCYELSNVPCLIADDPSLQRRLDNPALWYDPVHLLYPGAEIYSAWLGNRLASLLAPYKRVVN